jgi:hypothetical protein
MATIEGLFNFDEKLLTRQIAKDNYGASLGRATEGPWGPMVMGVNKIGNAIFNNDDKILREQTLANTALQETMEELGGDTSDMTKLYDMLSEKLVEKGASAETLMKLKSVQSTQANEKATTDANIAYRDQVNSLAQDQLLWKKQDALNKRAVKQKQEYVKGAKDPNHEYGQMTKAILKKATFGADLTDNGYKQTQSIYNALVSQGIDGGMDVVDAMRFAEEALETNYTYTEDTSWSDDNSSMKMNGNDGVTDVDTTSPEFLDLLEKNRTKTPE